MAYGYSDEFDTPWLDNPNQQQQQLQPGGQPAAPASPTPEPILSPTTTGGSSPWLESTSTPGVDTPPEATTPPTATTTPQGGGPGGVNPDPNAPFNSSAYPGNYSVNFMGAGGDKPHVSEYADLIGQLKSAADPSAAAVTLDQLGQKVQHDLEADGHKVTWNKNGQMIVDGRTYELGSGDWTQSPDGLGGQISALRGLGPASTNVTTTNGGNTGGAGGSAGGIGIDPGNTEIPPWLTDAPTYQPSGYLDTSLADMPNFKDLYAEASKPTAHEGELDSLISNILQHPESLSEQDVATLKAKAAENAAVAAQAQDEDLQHFGFSGGLNDSPWLAGQRADNEWKRRNTTIQADQNVDVAAADRRGADRRSAASLGTSYAGYQSSRKQAALNLSLDGALAKYGEQRNRTALNASMDQAAAQSGQSKAQLIANYVLTATGEKIDVARLNQQGEQFMQDLAYRVSQLKQQSDQFDAQMQLALQQFQHSKDNDAWTQAQATYGA